MDRGASGAIVHGLPRVRHDSDRAYTRTYPHETSDLEYLPFTFESLVLN